MAYSLLKFASVLFLCTYVSQVVICEDVDAGYDPYSAAQAMVDKAAHSW